MNTAQCFKKLQGSKIGAKTQVQHDKCVNYMFGLNEHGHSLNVNLIVPPYQSMSLVRLNLLMDKQENGSLDKVPY